jgi:hypothetical protein
MAMQKQIAERMVYISQSYAQKKIVDGLKNAHGMYYVSEILAQSKAYAKMKKEEIRNSHVNFDQNKKTYKEKIIEGNESNKERFTKIDAIYQADKQKFWELYT